MRLTCPKHLHLSSVPITLDRSTSPENFHDSQLVLKIVSLATLLVSLGANISIQSNHFEPPPSLVSLATAQVREVQLVCRPGITFFTICLSYVYIGPAYYMPGVHVYILYYVYTRMPPRYFHYIQGQRTPFSAIISFLAWLPS